MRTAKWGGRGYLAKCDLWWCNVTLPNLIEKHCVIRRHSGTGEMIHSVTIGWDGEIVEPHSWRVVTYVWACLWAVAERCHDYTFDGVRTLLRGNTSLRNWLHVCHYKLKTACLLHSRWDGACQQIAVYDKNRACFVCLLCHGGGWWV